MLNLVFTDMFIIKKKMLLQQLDHRKFVIELGMKLLGIDCPVSPPTLCCYSIPENVNFKVSEHFFISRTSFPKNKIHTNNTTCYLCNQCGKPIQTGGLKQLVFNFCSECCDQLQFPETFTFHSSKMKKKSKSNIKQ